MVNSLFAEFYISFPIKFYLKDVKITTFLEYLKNTSINQENKVKHPALVVYTRLAIKNTEKLSKENF